MTAIEARQYRKNIVREMINQAFKAGKNISKEKLIGYAEAEMGCSRNLIIGFIQSLKMELGFEETFNGILKKGKVQEKLDFTLNVE